MNILVTGGAGFIGSHLCEKLVKKGHRVVAIDNFDPLYPRAQKERNLLWLKKQKKFTFIEADVRNKKRMKSVFAKYKFECVYHLAGRGGIPQSKTDPFFYLDDIMNGTLVILELSTQHRIRLVVNASSSSVYGHTDGTASSEKDQTDKPLSVYAACKKSSELLGHVYHALYGLGIVNVRFFSVYGPRGRHDQVIYKFTKMIEDGVPIPIIKPDPLRDFTYVGDLVDGLVSMLKLPERCYEIINLGYGRPVTIGKVITLLSKELGKKAIAGKTIKPIASDTKTTRALSAYAGKRLNWKPKVSLEKGIKIFIEWYKGYQTPFLSSLPPHTPKNNLRRLFQKR